MASTLPKNVAGASPRPDPSASGQSTTNPASSFGGQLPPYTSSSSPKVANPRTSTNPTHRPNPRLKLTLPPPPYAAEALGNSLQGSGKGGEGVRNEDVGEEGQWFWYEGKRVYVRGATRRRVQSDGTQESPESLPLAEDQDHNIDIDIGDDEYDCGYAMDLGAESPSPSIGGSASGTPGLGPRSSSSLFGASSASSSASSSISPSSSFSSQDARLTESISRKPGGAGAMYKREVEGQEEADERLAREWAVAAGVASATVEPSTLVNGKRSRGTSVSAAYPPVTGSKQVSRRNSRSAQWDEADRDCGICFEYAVRPARTVCCGKLFCQEHLEDWLSGPNASGLCPNCDAECSLDKDVVSLVAPKLAKQKPTKSSTGGRISSTTGSAATTSTRRVSSSKVGLEPSSVISRSSSSQPLSSPVSSDDPPSPILTFLTSRASSTPTTPMYLNVPQQTLLSPPPSRSYSKGPSPGQLSPRSLLTAQQRYERLLAQEHRPSSPLSTNIPIVNPFDSVVVGDVLGGVEALGSRRGVLRGFGGEEGRVEFPSSGSIVELVEDDVERKDADTDSEKGYGGKEMGMWNGLEKGRKRPSGAETDPAHAVKHAASLVGCLVVLYLVVR